MELGFSQVKQSGFTETGAGAGNMTVLPRSDLYLTLSGAFEGGREYRVGRNGALLRLRGLVGVKQHLRDPGTFVSSGFASTGGANAQLVSVNSRDATVMQAEFGVDLLMRNGVAFRLDTQAEFGRQQRGYQGNFKISVPLGR